jgi:hypothetical protein
MRERPLDSLTHAAKTDDTNSTRAADARQPTVCCKVVPPLPAGGRVGGVVGAATGGQVVLVLLLSARGSKSDSGQASSVSVVKTVLHRSSSSNRSHTPHFGVQKQFPRAATVSRHPSVSLTVSIEQHDPWNT